MEASKEVRKMAVRVASTDPKLAFELTELAETMANDHRYGRLRSLVIRTAAADSSAKRILMPILQALKSLD